jgi:N6-adenosine-specific RNA methylase IME4
VRPLSVGDRPSPARGAQADRGVGIHLQDYYKTIGFIWVKVNKKNGKPSTGMGHYTRANAEICLLATRGKPRVKDHGVNRVILAPRREHPRKPNEQYPRIMRLFEGLTLSYSPELDGRAGRYGGWRRHDLKITVTRALSV